MKTNIEILTAVYAGYISAVYFTDTGDIDQPPADAEMAQESEFKAMSDCADFLAYCSKGGLLADLENELEKQNRAFSWDSFGIDFWLSRNGHGAGFFDRGLNDVGEKLQAAANTFGSSEVYAGDDSKIYFF